MDERRSRQRYTGLARVSRRRLEQARFQDGQRRDLPEAPDDGDGFARRDEPAVDRRHPSGRHQRANVPGIRAGGSRDLVCVEYVEGG
jgi:hypothetical protein